MTSIGGGRFSAPRRSRPWYREFPSAARACPALSGARDHLPWGVSETASGVRRSVRIRGRLQRLLRGAVFDNVGTTVAALARPVRTQHCLRGHPRGARRGEGASKLLRSHRPRCSRRAGAARLRDVDGGRLATGCSLAPAGRRIQHPGSSIKNRPAGAVRPRTIGPDSLNSRLDGGVATAMTIHGQHETTGP